MSKNWKKVRANSLRHGMELCLEYGKEKKNLSVDRVADLMGLSSKWTLYKWMESSRMPAILIPAFEHVCGIDFMTQYLAYSNHKLIIDIPAGKKSKDVTINEVQKSFTDAIGYLIKFYDGKIEADEALDSLTSVIGELAWHHGNVSKANAPELPLFGDDEDE